MKQITVVKVGGNEIDDTTWTARLAEAVAAFGGPIVLVHGGGKEVSELQRVLGAEPEWREGLRVTTPEAMRAVSMVLSGVVNKRLTSTLITAGVRAVGISGEDAGTLQAVPARGGQMGRTGEIADVDVRLLHALLAEGYTPVVSPVSRGPEGSALNVNADDSAAAVAAALEAQTFLLVSNVPGVLQDGAPLEEVDSEVLETLISDGVATGGMVPKLRAGLRASAGGVVNVRIGDLSMLTDDRSGTRLIARSDRESAVA